MKFGNRIQTNTARTDEPESVPPGVLTGPDTGREGDVCVAIRLSYHHPAQRGALLHRTRSRRQRAALGIWVGTGSREEKASENGAAHFIEHMLFKGTSTHTAREMAQRMDAIGGQMNAFTTKECTCFYGRALNTHLREAADILCSMFFDAKFAEEDVQTERGVILEEIGMYADDPADLVMERMSAAIYKGSSLARPILGKKSTLEKMTGQWLKEYKQSHYTPDRVVVSLAGSFEDTFVEELMERFAAMEPGHLKPSKPAVYQPP